MTVRVKICGIQTADALQACVAAGAEAFGLVFTPKSRRAITPEAAAFSRNLAGPLTSVGLFVDADDNLIDAAVRLAGLKTLQLHGAESPERLHYLQQRHQLPVWKAVGVKTAADIRLAVEKYRAADLLLLDAKAATEDALPGGNGQRFDWRLLSAYRPDMPWGLAGGLTPATVAMAIAETGAPLVDVSSGVESAPGVKDNLMIHAFVKAAKGGK